MDEAAGGHSALRRAVTVLLTVIAGWLVALGPGVVSAFADNDNTDNPPVLAESFESGSGLPAGWRFLEWTKGNSTVAIVSGAAADGTHFLRIVSNKPNHARVVAPVRVTPNTSYRLRVMAKARGANANMAAVLGVDGQYTVTDSVRTDMQWVPLELYFKTGPRTSVDLTMGLGHFGQLNVGSADFDAVTVTQVGAIPNGATVADLAAATAAPAAPAQPDTAAGSSFTQGPNKAIWVFVGILTLVGIGATVFLMRRSDPTPAPETDPEPSANPGTGPDRVSDRAD